MILANELSKQVKAVAQEFCFTPEEMRRMTLRDLTRYYSKHKPISAKRKNNAR